MDIVVCTDKRNIMPTGVMMTSVCVNNTKEDICFHVVTDEDVSSSQRNDLKEVVSLYSRKTVTFYTVPQDFLKIHFPNVDSRIPRTAYFRLFLTELLPKTIDMVLYFDGDIIVRHPLLEIWNTDITNYAVAAVPDYDEGLIEKYNRLCYPPSLGYFNSGVLLINLKFWREHRVLNQFLDCMQKHADKFVNWDQDVLNFVFCGQKLMLPIKYNLQHGHLWKVPRFDYWKYEQQLIEARKDPVIIHYTLEKPWMKYVQFRNPYSSLFYKYQDMTKWKGVKVDNWSFKKKMRTLVVAILRKMKFLPVRKSKFVDVNLID